MLQLPSTCVVSAGGALRACDSELLPIPEDCNGRYRMRVELSTTVVPYAFELGTVMVEGEYFVVSTAQDRGLATARVHAVNTPVPGTT